jgi:hypothetical protein
VGQPRVSCRFSFKTSPLHPYALLVNNIPEVTAAIAAPNTKDVTFPQLGGNVDGVDLLLPKVSLKVPRHLGGSSPG